MSKARSGSKHSLPWIEEQFETGGTTLAVLKAGKGRPLLILHEELGHPGPLDWHGNAASERTLWVPLHPGFGRSPRAEWVSSMRDLACFYARFLRERGLVPLDVVGASFGGWLAAEMVANDPSLFRRMVLIAPPGIRPPDGEILDMFKLTARKYLQATVLDPSRAEEFSKLFGGEQTPEQFEAWEEARAEIARLAWSPYLFDPSLPQLLQGVTVPTLIFWGAQDAVVPPGVGQAYQRVLGGSKLVVFEQCGHRPDIERREDFTKELLRFLD